MEQTWSKPGLPLLCISVELADEHWAPFPFESLVGQFSASELEQRCEGAVGY